ncbi:hypothetical protein E3T26_06985 [Cryobacterium sp. TMT1-21]|uniref:hypothetical protein n=1 Tax=Cryobacterium sp. TMT1-21 TaxID=1259234 RepID=UPI00106D2EFA|nr:hypothetical protein [Cryobacterium sp. TMT1-21]TFD15521.1 hypothetical protein E3T26_06985 [Cryobacterium sp. TMT1-21]
MPNRRQLLDAHTHLNAAILESEPWEASYKASPSTFKRLVHEEAALQASANEYLLGLADRIPQLINWNDPKLMQLRADTTPPMNDGVWKAEAALLMASVLANITELQVIGANAGEIIYSIPMGFSNLNEAILVAAETQTAQMVSQVNESTRRYIQQSIKTSIELGEDGAAMKARIMKRISNPVRAEMIAQTEAVTAYQSGIELFAVETGAESSTWDALLGACGLCRPIDGVTVPIGEDFTLGNGTKVTRPPGHVRCRCGRIINYPK